MTWLFVLSVPGLLMAAAFGLERVEAGLRVGSEIGSAPPAPRALNPVFQQTRQADRV